LDKGEDSVTSGDISILEYRDISKDLAFRKGWTERDWQELRLYAKLLKTRSIELGIEDPVKYDDHTINLGSYCGRYTLTNPRNSISVLCRHFNENEIRQIVKEVIQWCARLGPDILSYLRSYLPIDKHEYILNFSMMLRELTEQILNSYITPLIEEKVIISPCVMGSINIPQTSRYLLQGKTLIANRKLNMNFISLPILLLIRFNYEMIYSLNNFLFDLGNWINDERDSEVPFTLENLTKSNILFHSNILNLRRFRFLLDRALDINFEDGTIIDQTLQQASSNDSLKDLVYLWEIFKGSRSLLPQLKQILLGGYTLKPMSKLFELWVLKQLTSILERLTNSSYSYEVGTKGSMTFTFNKVKPRIRLYFNPRSISHLLKFNNVTWRLRPDFIISIGDHITNPEQVIVADAKYKIMPESSDEQKMLEYLLAFGLKKEDEVLNGLFIHVGDKAVDKIKIFEKSRRFPDVKLSYINIRPSLESRFQENLLRVLDQIIY